MDITSYCIFVNPSSKKAFSIPLMNVQFPHNIDTISIVLDRGNDIFFFYFQILQKSFFIILIYFKLYIICYAFFYTFSWVGKYFKISILNGGIKSISPRES